MGKLEDAPVYTPTLTTDLILHLVKASDAQPDYRIALLKLLDLFVDLTTAQTLTNKKVGSGSSIGDASNLLPVFTSAIQIGAGGGSLTGMLIEQVTITSASIAADASLDEAHTVTGILASDFIIPMFPAGVPNKFVISAWASAADTITTRAANTSDAGAVTLPATVVNCLVVRMT